MMVEGAKPIENDCKAMLVNALKHTGQTLTVKYCIGLIKGCEEFGPFWETDYRVDGNQGGLVSIHPEQNLLRIDDPEIQEQIEDELEVVV